jgi:hypothetical protein
MNTHGKQMYRCTHNNHVVIVNLFIVISLKYQKPSNNIIHGQQQRGHTLFVCHSENGDVATVGCQSSKMFPFNIIALMKRDELLKLVIASQLIMLFEFELIIFHSFMEFSCMSISLSGLHQPQHHIESLDLQCGPIHNIQFCQNV